MSIGRKKRKRSSLETNIVFMINKKRKKKNNGNKWIRIESNRNYYKESTNTGDGREIYPTEKKSSELVYAERGKSKDERLSDERVKKFVNKREKIKQIENRKKYNDLMIKIGEKQRLEELYIRHFKKDIDTLDFIDELDSIIESKNINESELVFIREYIYKIHNK